MTHDSLEQKLGEGLEGNTDGKMKDWRIYSNLSWGF